MKKRWLFVAFVMVAVAGSSFFWPRPSQKDDLSALLPYAVSEYNSIAKPFEMNGKHLNGYHMRSIVLRDISNEQAEKLLRERVNSEPGWTIEVFASQEDFEFLAWKGHPYNIAMTPCIQAHRSKSGQDLAVLETHPLQKWEKVAQDAFVRTEK